MGIPTVTFNDNIQPDFYKTLRKRVNAHFRDNNISIHANTNMKLKTAFMILTYFTPLILIITGVVSSFWGILLMWTIMGFGMAGIGLAIMHDANHGAYSKNKRIGEFNTTFCTIHLQMSMDLMKTLKNRELYGFLPIKKEKKYFAFKFYTLHCSTEF
jgi:hypothetical protein